MVTYPNEIVITKNQECLLRTKLPAWHLLLHTHWDYYLRLLKETWRSSKTIQNTLASLQMFLLHSNCFTIESWSNGKIIQEEFLRLKKERAWSGSTYNTYRKGMSSYFQVLCNAGIINENPMHRIKKCPEVPRDQPWFKGNQVTACFEAINAYKTWVSHILFQRNKLFFLLCAFTGARPIELLSLKLSSFSWDRTTVSIVSAKWSGKTRMYTLTEVVKEALRNYIRECAIAWREQELSHHFFLGDSAWCSWTSSGIQQVCKRLSVRTGFKVTAYMFRRLVATQLFENNIPIQNIQQHMGHTRASTTLRYVQSNERMNDMGIWVMSSFLCTGTKV